MEPGKLAQYRDLMAKFSPEDRARVRGREWFSLDEGGTVGLSRFRTYANKFTYGASVRCCPVGVIVIERFAEMGFTYPDADAPLVSGTPSADTVNEYLAKVECPTRFTESDIDLMRDFMIDWDWGRMSVEDLEEVFA